MFAVLEKATDVSPEMAKLISTGLERPWGFQEFFYLTPQHNKTAKQRTLLPKKGTEPSTKDPSNVTHNVENCWPRWPLYHHDSAFTWWLQYIDSTVPQNKYQYLRWSMKIIPSKTSGGMLFQKKLKNCNEQPLNLLKCMGNEGFDGHNLQTFNTTSTELEAKFSILEFHFLAVQVIFICVYITNYLHFFTMFLSF